MGAAQGRELSAGARLTWQGADMVIFQGPILLECIALSGFSSAWGPTVQWTVISARRV